MSDEKTIGELYIFKRKLQREKRDIRKKILGIDEDHTDTSMQRNYGIATKTKRALKIELFGSKSKASATDGEETSIETFVREVLEEFQIKFIEQKAISFVNVDFYLPDYNLAIQVHGDYWHACPVCYPDGAKNKTQRKNIEKDKQANQIIEESNIKILEIWEHEIKDDPEMVREKIERIIK